MRIRVFLVLPIITLIFIVFSGFSSKKAQAESYPCQTYSGSNKCIDLSISSACNGTSPTVTWSWTKKFNNTSFTIVYSRNGNWYMETLGNVTSWTMTNPPFGGPGSGGTDNTALRTGEYIGGKISGGTAPSITTGYTNPDVGVTVKDCTAPTNPPPTPTSSPTSGPTGTPVPTGTPTPAPTTGNLTLQIQGIDSTTTPLHQIRQVVLYFYPSTDTSFQHSPYIAKGNITYNPSNGYFSNASFPLTGLVAGKYLVLARTLQGSLVAQIGTGDGTGPITIVNTGGANLLVDTQDNSDTNADTTVPVLLMGDFITDCSSSGCDFNYIHTLDWSAIVDCFGDKKTSATCSAHGTFPNTQDTVTDINDDGQVDGIDYTILMKNYGAFGIGQQTMNRGNPPQ